MSAIYVAGNTLSNELIMRTQSLVNNRYDISSHGTKLHAYYQATVQGRLPEK